MANHQMYLFSGYSHIEFYPTPSRDFKPAINQVSDLSTYHLYSITSTMAKLGSKSTKLASGALKSGSNALPVSENAGGSSKVASSSKVSDALRQAVMDLGGDDGDLELIEGIEDDGEDIDFAPQVKGKEIATDEVGPF